jgi:hypothetical protein
MDGAANLNRQAKIIVIDDDIDWCKTVTTFARIQGHKIESANTIEDSLAKIQEAQSQNDPFSIAIIDMQFVVGKQTIKGGKDVLIYIKTNHPYIGCIMASGELNPSYAFDLRDDFDLDYCMLKDDTDRLGTAIKKASERIRLKSITEQQTKTPSINDVPVVKPFSSSPQQTEKTVFQKPSAPKIFISYSHRDEDFKNELVSTLSVLQRRGIIDTWQDREIKPGDEWYRSIRNAMDECQIALLLVSRDFLNSEFIIGNELPVLFQRRKDAGLRAIPIIVRACLWQGEPILQDLQALPKDGKPVSTFPHRDRDKIWTDIGKEIEKLARIITT